MPLTQPQRIGLARLLGHLRPDWHDAGTHSAVVTLATEPDPPSILCARAILSAGIASNRTPESINFVEAKRPSLSLIANTAPECKTHGGRTVRDDGEYACCWAEQTGDPEPYRRHDVTRPPADFAAQVQAAKGGPPMDPQTPVSPVETTPSEVTTT